MKLIRLLKNFRAGPLPGPAECRPGGGDGGAWRTPRRRGTPAEAIHHRMLALTVAIGFLTVMLVVLTDILLFR